MLYSIEKEAARDARRYAVAKMNYGKGAGTQRKMLSVELNEKFKNPAYEEAFNDALTHVDMNDIRRSVETRKNAEKTVKAVKSTYRGARKAKRLYDSNRSWIDELVSYILSLLG